jgi:dynactin 1
MSDSKLNLGDRVDVNGVAGTIRFVGTTAFALGKWVGVELDEPNGKNDGTVVGKKYFDCPPSHGVFVRAAQVKALISRPTTPRVASRASLVEYPIPL